MILVKTKLQMKVDKTINIIDTQIKSATDIIELVNSINQAEGYNASPTETVVVIALNTKNQVLAYNEIATGNTSTCNIDPANIFRFIFTLPASKFILVHNHPSGDTTPSNIDIQMTNKIKDLSAQLNIQFLDHIIIGDNDYTSIFKYIENKGVK